MTQKEFDKTMFQANQILGALGIIGVVIGSIRLGFLYILGI